MTTQIQLYDALTQTKEPLRTRVPGSLGLYVCGMTVYDDCHLGHARVMVFFDTLVRWLRQTGLDVCYVRNITDVDDKIIRRAQERGMSMAELTAETIQSMHDDSDALGLLRPDVEPRATAYIPEMIAMIETLIERGHAYVSAGGDVCYRVSTFPSYGRLANKYLDELRAGERVPSDAGKEAPEDFVLWKVAKAGEPAWSSPWGDGRPGWHIECSAMSTNLLDLPIDIHGGGVDLKFPHHENEIAQSEAACGCTFVNTWMHVGHVQVKHQKMSKSLGNFQTIKELLKQYPAEVIRLFLLSTHYRHPVNVDDAALDQAWRTLTRVYTALRGVGSHTHEPIDWSHPFLQRCLDALADDVNTPQALAVWYEGVKALNQSLEAQADDVGLWASMIRAFGQLLGLGQLEADVFLRRSRSTTSTIDDATIEAWIAARDDARARRAWDEADAWRARLKEAGIVLEDGAGKTVWRRS